ncbi:hypothetical protein BJ138DRAFT_1168185 [Hygrophoropsis aurantiaca]|uniref:Uncharacterized protein n=1 Tax=Hygrophoropsis aurantiaca TaxID=72124 RepID=A0ACB7ZST0_9AGAM|nr:hypothetical protein BJ138DRAFT_1168185 [Hygrophoropsis aurantiaca]
MHGSKLSVEESVRFSPARTEGAEEWLWTGTVGDHSVHFGPDNRYFSVSVTHQQHCGYRHLLALQENGLPEGHDRYHITHCLNYLRQSTLCAADITLGVPRCSFS